MTTKCPPTAFRAPKSPASASPTSAAAADLAALSTASIRELRAYYHSVHAAERAEVIALLGSMSDPAAARELVALYAECEWRSTRLEIVRALANHPGSRGLELLFRLAQEKQDTPLAEAAIASLGQTHDRMAARFLVHYYESCQTQGNESLKPAIVGALGQIPDRTLVRELVAELPLAIERGQVSLTKNLVLTLGELKAREALPALTSLAASRARSLGQASTVNPDLALSALVSIGKISRDPRALDTLEPGFRSDPFEYQLYTGAKTQAQFRSQWKLEDYLTRLFGAGTTHPSLPYELSQFSPADVREGLRLFAGADNLEALCRALGRIDFEGIAEWYEDLIDFGSLDTAGVTLVLRSLACHLDTGVRKPLERLARHPACQTPAGKLTWLLCASLALPDAEHELRSFFAEPNFSFFDVPTRIAALNLLVDHGLCVQTQGARLQGVTRLLESCLDSNNTEISARALRGLATLRCPSKKAQQFARAALRDAASIASALHFFECCPEKNGIMLDAAALAGNEPAALRCLAAQSELGDAAEIAEKLAAHAIDHEDTRIRIDALRMLARHPIPSLLARVREQLPADARALKEDSLRVALAAVITLKAYGAPATESRGASLAEADGDAIAGSLAPMLQSSDPSLAGRALDTLTRIEGARAKRILIDHLREREADADVCDKIARCLATPTVGAEYFVSVIDGVLRRHPEHPRLDALVALRERMQLGASQTTRTSIKAVDIAALDRELGTKIAGYEELEEPVRSALRSAELPYVRPELFDDHVDKSGSLVEYAKAIDIHLEKVLGRRHLFNKLENQLHEFQSALHAAGLGDDFPVAERVLAAMGLERHFNAQSFPLHKMLTVAQGIRNGRIVNDRFKTLDGLRAWAVMLLVFARKFGGTRPLVALRGDPTDDQIATLCKRLIALQEVRNPAAHRQTVSKLAAIDETRAEALAVLALIQRLF